MPNRQIKKLMLVVFVITYLLNSACLLLACYGATINDGDYWFLGLFPLASVYILLLELVFIIAGFFLKPLLSLPGIIIMALCISPIQQLIPFRAPAVFTMVKKPDHIRVMSWNVEHFDILEHKAHPETKAKMIDLINEYQPDIACFQEMVAGDHPKNRINYLAEFQQKLNIYRYYYSFNPLLDFDNLHHFGIIIFSKYPILHEKTLEYRPYDYNSIFQYIDILKGTDTIRVINIHLQSLRFTPQNREYIDNPIGSGKNDIRESKSILSKFRQAFIKRHRQADRVQKAIIQSPYPVILCGDFNDVPNSYAYNAVGRHLKNSFAEKGYGIGSTFSGISPTLRIDNIFSDKKFEVMQYARIKKKMSDHYPVVADLQLKH